jgi:sugar O-acyltransferase (sialic acid O-acetyltransferase NeuD family)
MHDATPNLMRPLSERYGLIEDTRERVVIIGASNPESERMMEATRDPAKRIYLGFIDNRVKGDFCGLPIFGGFEQLSQLIDEGCVFINAVSRDTRDRKDVTDKVLAAGGSFVNFIHPSVNLSGVKVGTGVYIQEGCIIQAGVEIGDMTALHLGCLVAHGAKIGAHCFTTAGTIISGDCVIGDGAFIGVGATILPRLTVGAWATVGAGAVVTKDVLSWSTVVGCPARLVVQE